MGARENDFYAVSAGSAAGSALKPARSSSSEELCRVSDGLPVCLSVVFVWLSSVRLSAWLPACLPACPLSVRLSVCLFVCLAGCLLPVSLSGCLCSVWLSVWLSPVRPFVRPSV